ncbi:MAG: alcohol dehydrogenase catalytic domain-containing protein [Nocardioidaceae bacterium]
MRALVFVSPGRVEMRDEPDPVAVDGEEVVTVHASGICGSELHGFRHTGMRVPPLIMGHEFVGTTTSGRRVAVNPLLTCGECDLCIAGRPQVCRRRGLIGVNRAGGFAETVAVPKTSLLPLPDVLPWSAAALVEPLANAVHAWSLLPAEPERLAVVGAGPIGLLCGLLAQARGADVTLSEPSYHRRKVAGDLGLNVTEELTEEYDAVVDAVGLPVTRRASIDWTRPGGTTVWIGLAQDDVELSGNGLVRDEKTIRGSFAYTPAEFAEALALAPGLDLSWTTDVPLTDAATIFYGLAEGRTDVVKAVLVPEAS